MCPDAEASPASLDLPAVLSVALRRAAERAYPAESCGLLIGSTARGRARVIDIVPAHNEAARTDRFLIGSEQVWAAIRESERRALRLVGAYHSHPEGSSEPSATDRLEAWGELLQVITSCHGAVAGTTRCWRPRAGGLIEVPVRVVGAASAGE